ncbi:GNAT family N-acetyltransferase [Tepidamorphus sp. 3E244]|uniref:GNAT family N-acetyltransferase n=1 Tax=Tepidamorphus sp. 3E244 TaxID=3385498 RepID=UPI0038FC7957
MQQSEQFGACPADDCARVADEAKASNRFPVTVQVKTSAGTWALSVHDSFESAAAVWDELSAADPAMTPYQHPRFLKAWYTLLGKHEGIQLRIVSARTEAGDAAFVWPLGLCNCFAMPSLGWLGGKHANYAMGVHSRSAADLLKPKDWRALMDAAGRASGADVAVLHNQPERFNGFVNPLIALRTTSSASPCHTVRLQDDSEALLQRLRGRFSRKKMRKKLRKLENEHGEVRLVRALNPEDCAQALAALRSHKHQLDIYRPDRLLFSRQDVIDFLSQAALTDPSDGDNGIEIFTLRAGDEIAATFGCAVGNGRAAGMFISVDAARFAHSSPGEILISKLLEHYIERGLDAIDFGVGAGEYKRRWCHDDEPLFDSVQAFTVRGQVLAGPLQRGILGLKNVIKRSPKLTQAIQRMQTRFASGQAA